MWSKKKKKEKKMKIAQRDMDDFQNFDLSLWATKKKTEAQRGRGWPGDLPDPRIQPTSPALAGGFFTTESPGKPLLKVYLFKNFVQPSHTTTFLFYR